jgi:hypothetical protein
LVEIGTEERITETYVEPTGVSCSGDRPVVGFCEHGNETVGFHETRGIIDQLSDN